MTFFGLILWIFLQTLSPNQSEWIGENSLFGIGLSKPGGLGFRPMLDQDNNGKSTLIWINRNLDRTNTYWGTELNNFFDQKYKNSTKLAGNPPVSCSFGSYHATKDHACFIERSTMLNTACSWEAYKFGYGDGMGRPCVLIQLDKINNWIPQSYETLEDLALAKQKGMPDALVENIRNMIQRNPNDPELKTIWVSCDGENPADRENIGPMEYYSAGIVGYGNRGKQFQGIPNYFFPYQNQDNYRAPFVFVKFVRAHKNVLILVECKAWAKNIEEQRGSVHFELMID